MKIYTMISSYIQCCAHLIPVLTELSLNKNRNSIDTKFCAFKVDAKRIHVFS